MRRWIILAGSICALLAAPVLAVEWLYHRGLAGVDTLPTPPPTDGLSEAMVQVAWLEFEGVGPVHVQPTGPHRLAATLALDHWLGVPGRHKGVPGFHLASQCAKRIVSDQDTDAPRSVDFHLSAASLSIWLGRNWSTEEVMACTLDRAYYGRGRIGMEAAAWAYFDRPAADLAHDEIALLMVAQRNPSRLEPHCDPSALRRDIGELLVLLQLEAARSNPQLLITRRLSEAVWFNGRIRCVLPDDIDPDS